MSHPTRMARRPAPEVVFVLPSGGSTGATQVGMMRALLEAGIVPDAFVGSSVGALNAAFMAPDPTPRRAFELSRIWQSLCRHHVFGRSGYYTLSRLVTRQDHIYTPAPLRALIARFCPLERLEVAPVAVHVVTTDLDNGIAKWWDRGPAADILYAGACLPGLFPPAVLGGHRHVDGGVLEPVPVGRALDIDATTIYVLGEPAGPQRRPAGRLNALEVLIRSFDISRYARLPEPAAMARPGQRVVTIPGADCSSVSITDFSQTARLIDESYRMARQALAGSPGPVAGPMVGLGPLRAAAG